MPSFGAAVALGAEEIEFDLWYTKDGEVVSLHDSDLERVSDGTGKVYDHTYEELLKYDFGIKHSEKFKGLKIIKFEEILKKFACHVIMNIHIKSVDNVNPLSEEYLKKIIDLIRKYDCEKYSYFMTGNDTVLGQLQSLAPDICRCCGGGDAPLLMVERGIKYGCKKIQLVKWAFNEEMIKKAHDNGMRCTIFWSDEIDEAKKFLDMGVDVILTNDYQKISQILK